MKTLNVVCVLFVMIFPVAISIAQPHPPDSLWSQTYGGHTLYGVQQTPDGGYILAGWEGSGGYDADFYAIKTRADGSAQWTRVFGTPYNEMCFSVQQTFDNSYVLGGYSYYELFASDMWLIKMNANGDSLWGRSYRGVFDENICYAVEQTTDTGYILAGCTGYSDGEEWNVLLVKTDSSGNSIWTREYLIGYSSLCNSVQQTSDGGYILAGYAHIIINTNYAKVLLMKTDEDGDSLWSHVYGGDRFNVSYSVAQTSDGGYILAGYTNSYGSGYTDFWLMKTDENGDSSWSRTYGGAHADACFSLQQTSDDGYILAGSTSSFGSGDNDFWLVKTDSNGDSLWSRSFGGERSDVVYSVEQTSDGGYILAGNSFPPDSNSYQTWVIKTGPELDTESQTNLFPTTHILHQNYPNPFNPSTQISYYLPKTGDVTLIVYDLLGREVETLARGIQSAGNYSIEFNGSDLASGVYLYRLQVGDFAATKKMMLLK